MWNHALQLDPMALRALFLLVMVESPTSTAAWFGMSGYFDNTLQFLSPNLIDFLRRTGVLRRMGGESVPTRTAEAECRAASRPMSGTLRSTFLELENQSRSRRKLAKRVARNIPIVGSSRSGRKTCRRTMAARCLGMTLSLGTSKRQKTTFRGQQNVQVRLLL